MSCPSFSCYYIEGSEQQALAVKPKEAEKYNKKVDDFGF